MAHNEERGLGTFDTHRKYWMCKEARGKQSVIYLMSLCKQMAEQGLGEGAKRKNYWELQRKENSGEPWAHIEEDNYLLRGKCIESLLP